MTDAFLFFGAVAVIGGVAVRWGWLLGRRAGYRAGYKSGIDDGKRGERELMEAVLDEQGRRESLMQDALRVAFQRGLRMGVLLKRPTRHQRADGAWRLN